MGTRLPVCMCGWRYCFVRPFQFKVDLYICWQNVNQHIIIIILISKPIPAHVLTFHAHPTWRETKNRIKHKCIWNESNKFVAVFCFNICVYIVIWVLRECSRSRSSQYAKPANSKSSQKVRGSKYLLHFLSLSLPFSIAEKTTFGANAFIVEYFLGIQRKSKNYLLIFFFCSLRAIRMCCCC